MIEWYVSGIVSAIVFWFASSMVQSWLEQRQEKKYIQQRIEGVIRIITRDCAMFSNEKLAEDLFHEFLKKETNRQWLRNVLKENDK